MILSTATRYLLPLLLMFSIFLLLRGHNEPGGGFVGGLVAGAALALYAMALGLPSARQVLGIEPADTDLLWTAGGGRQRGCRLSFLGWSL